MIEEGTYFAIGIFKDYRVRFLECLAWNLNVNQDTEINAKIDCLEVSVLTLL